MTSVASEFSERLATTPTSRIVWRRDATIFPNDSLLISDHDRMALMLRFPEDEIALPASPYLMCILLSCVCG